MRYLTLFVLLFSFVRAQNNYMLSFDAASSEYASVATTAIANQTGFFSFWIVCDNLTTFYFPVSFARTDFTDRFVRIDTRTDGKLRITQRDGDVQDQVESSDALSVATPHHVVAGSNGSAFFMWIDGKSQTLSIIGGANNGDWIADVTQGGTSQSFAIGVKIGSTPSGYFPGDLDEIIYSSTIPTQAIVNNIYNGGTPKDETNASQYTLVHYWRLEEGTGTSSVDSKGSLNLTLVNTPTWVASVFGWGDEFLSFKTYLDFRKFKGF